MAERETASVIWRRVAGIRRRRKAKGPRPPDWRQRQDAALSSKLRELYGLAPEEDRRRG